VLSCQEFSDRLYDEDCRRALAHRGPVPADAALHRDSCADCRSLWAEAAEDLATLPELLCEPAPPALEARVRRELAKGPSRPANPWFVLDWTAGITWAAIGASLALMAVSHLPAGLAGMLFSSPGSTANPTHLALAAPTALLGASVAFAASAVRQAVRDALG
jgi:hypothetical protein